MIDRRIRYDTDTSIRVKPGARRKCVACQFLSTYIRAGIDEYKGCLDDEYYVCARFPPVYLGGDPIQKNSWGQPIVNLEDGCGYFDA